MGQPTAIVSQSIGIGVCVNPIHCPFCPLPMSGVVITGSLNKKVNNLAAACVTHMVLSYCGHVGMLVTGSSSVKVNGLSQCTVGSQFVGDFIGNLVTGATNHMTG